MGLSTLWTFSTVLFTVIVEVTNLVLKCILLTIVFDEFLGYKFYSIRVLQILKSLKLKFAKAPEQCII